MAIPVDENPPELLAPLDDPSLVGCEWCVARTKSRHEKVLAWHLVSVRVPYFLPMKLVRTVSRNTVLNPLFPGIVFICFRPGDSSLGLARESRLIGGNFMFTKLQARLRAELALIASETFASRTLRSEHGPFRTGDAVRVREGPMMGLEGRVAQMPGEAGPRIFVDLIFMGKHSMEIDAKLLEAL
jgi:transcription antitermination factor NusG